MEGISQLLPLAILLHKQKGKMEALRDHPIPRILIIEDDDGMRALLKDVLEEEGFQADSASNGLAGLQKLREGRFDLVITDIHMPGLTGLDILPGIKKLQPSVPVIVITAFGSSGVYRRSIQRGASAYLEKPIRIDRLKALIHEMVAVGRENGSVSANPV